MSALQELQLHSAASSAAGASPAVVDAAVRLVGPFMWRWYQAHRQEKILKVRPLGLFSVMLLVKDLRPVFVALFGEDPERI